MVREGIQVVFSYIPSMAGKDTERVRRTHLIKGKAGANTECFLTMGQFTQNLA